MYDLIPPRARQDLHRVAEEQLLPAEPVAEQAAGQGADEHADQGVGAQGTGGGGVERADVARVVHQGGQDGAVDREVVPVEEQGEEGDGGHRVGGAPFLDGVRGHGLLGLGHGSRVVRQVTPVGSLVYSPGPDSLPNAVETAVRALSARHAPGVTLATEEGDERVIGDDALRVSAGREGLLARLARGDGSEVEADGPLPSLPAG